MSTEAAPCLRCGTAKGSRSVIEAAAGTGKTHNITRIVARLIMEREDSPIENMVIVTFTRAAAAELKTRISSLLADLSLALESGQKEDELIELAKRQGIAERDLKKRLHLAQLNFDQAPIGTIHGFAMRVLSENGFGSRQKLGFTLNEETGALIGELCGDYFRALLLNDPDDREKYRSPEEIRLLTGKDALALNVEKIRSYVTARMSAAELKAGLPLSDLSGTRVDEAVRTAVNVLEKASQGETPPKEVKKLLAEVMAVICEDAFRVVSRKFRQLSEENNFLSQDDLIFRLRQALRENPKFREALQKKYTVGLIDEFQDTSTAQFDIFRSLFLENPGSTFIVVGDPRQAIYRFRYCDLNAYLDAVEEMKKQGAALYQMNVNRRSGARYIEALNAIFTPRGSFALEGLDMPEQQALEGSQVLWNADGKEVEFPIQVFHDKEKKTGLYSILKQCAQDIAGLLDAGFLIPAEKDAGGNIVKEARPLGPGDIAVLLNTGWENGRRLQSELLKLGVPAVMAREGNVFLSPEAQELIRFLEGVLNPDDGAARLRALITPLGDLDFARMRDEDKAAAGAAKLQNLLDTWQKRSFGVMYALLCREFRLYDRLNTPEGRRKIGKYNALADYLSEAAFSRKLTPNALFGELCRCVENAPDADKEFPAPPETDRGAVIINTVFGSKGLSYPAVFLPDFFIGKRNKLSGSCRCHVGKEEFLLPPVASDLAEGLPEEARRMYQLERDEEIRENLRKAYVAFTRARYFCRFYCGISQTRDPDPRSKRKGSWPRNAATDWLFRRIAGTAPESFGDLAALMTSEKFFTAEPHFPREVGTECVFSPRSAPDGVPAEEFRRPDRLRDLGFSRGFLSFSGLLEGHHVKENSFAPENDDENAPEDDEEMMEMQKFRGGTTFGNAIHKLLEHVDFTSDRERLERAVAQTLRAYGFHDEEMEKLAGKMLWNTFHSPLPDGRGGTFRLCGDIAAARKKSEFEFLCEFSHPDRFSSAELFHTVRNYFVGKTGCREVPFPALNEFFSQGFFNGSIDLFFEYGSRYYIVDWKTNLLKGRNPYSGAALAAAMAENGYCLQYLIYTAALFKYLKLRLKISPENERSFYDKRFGGVLYLFVRGMNPDRPGSGVFADTPPFDICKKMEGFIG